MWIDKVCGLCTFSVQPGPDPAWGRAWYGSSASLGAGRIQPWLDCRVDSNGVMFSDPFDPNL